MKKHNKKLPKYNLGTMRHIDPGYLSNREIGTPQFSSQPGIEDINSDIRAARRNIYSSAFNTATQSMLFPMQMLLNIHDIPASVNFGGTSMLNDTINVARNTVLDATTGALVKAVESTAKPIASLGAKNVLSTAGKALGVIGGLYGLANMGMLFGEAGDYRTAGLMLNTAPRNTYSTAGGNQYNTYGGVSLGKELSLNNAQAKSRQLNFALNSIGTGLSFGGLLGLPGMFAGAGIGGLVGVLGSVLGLGDNEDEIRHQQELANNAIAGYNRMSKAVSESKDLEAANGKMPGFHNGKANARVSNGEVIGNFEDGYFRVPGSKNNKDTVKTHLGKEDYVISNKHGLSDYAWTTGDIPGALAALSYLLKTGLMNKYKNGKTPRYWLGKAGDYITSIAPHIASLASNISLYNRAKYADTYVPELYVDNPEGTRAVNELANLRFDVDPYYREATRGLNQANWNVRRNVGLGIGGRAVALNANYTSYLGGLRDIAKMYNDAQNAYREKYANALASLGATNQGRRMEAVAKRHALLQQARGAKENWMAQYRKNIDQALLNAAAEYMRIGQYNDSFGIQNKMLGLYEQGVENDKIKTLALINNLLNNGWIPTSIERNTPINEFNSRLEGLTPAEKQAMYGKWARRALALGIV